MEKSMREKFNNQAIVVPLTGGLGNQIFQFSFALHCSSLTNLPYALEKSIAKPRLTSGHASICELNLGDDPILTMSANGKLRRLATKVYGWNLVNGINGRHSNFLYAGVLMNFISRLVFFLTTHFWARLHVSKGLGFDSEITESGSGGIFVGYFQTYMYSRSQEVFSKLMLLKPTHVSKLLSESMATVDLIAPILLHVRLTDYLAEDSFGVPDKNYYLESLRVLKKNGLDKPVWVFSDDIESAKKHLSGVEEEFQLHFFESAKLSDVENWHLMRRFSAYVIANSSYSWWAAFLREDQSAVVIYPQPWFRAGEAPRDLFPLDWLPIRARRS
jgi:hypothetical protein